MAVYELKIGPGGSKLKEWVDSSTAAGAPPASGISWGDGFGVTRRMAGWPMNMVVTWLEVTLNQPVVDATGLPGKYDITPHYFPERLFAINEPDAGPGLVDAVQSQLGLKLQLAKRMMPVWIVDHVERVPTGN